MTADILPQIGLASLAGSLAILSVLVARSLLRNTLGARSAYALWLVVPIAMVATLLPADLVITSPPAGTVSLTASVPQQTPLTTTVQGTISEKETGLPTNNISLTATAFWVWFAGFAASFGYLLARHYHSLGRLKASKIAGRVLMSKDKSTSPAVVGFLKPKIVLPRDFNRQFNRIERALILAHENTHIRRGDTRINLFGAFLKSINWFNPLFHYAQRKMNIDQELACDERVMERHGKHRQTYAETLLRAQIFAQTPNAPLGCSWSPENGHPLKTRIEQLRDSKLIGKRSLATTITLALSFLLTGSAAWAAFASNTVYISVPEATENSAATIVIADQDDVTDAEKAEAQGYALAYALSEGNRSHARTLIKLGADVNYEIRGDGTPLIMASRMGDGRLVKLLLEAGADVNKPSHGDGNPLIVAARRGRLDIVEQLVAAGADPNGFVLGDETPLIGAAAQNSLDVARFLIKSGANVNLKVETGNHGFGRSKYRSPLGQAILYGNDRMAELLRRNGATEPTARED